MFEIDIKRLDFSGKNFLKIQHISLENDIQAVILLSLSDKKLEELLYNKILDVLIDRIHPKNVYKDFSHALENINAFLVNWKKSDDSGDSILQAVIGIYAKKSFYFSCVGRSSCYLYNSHKDIIEITDKNECSKDFSYISSGEVADGETLILSTYRLLDTLSHDDMKDALEYETLIHAGNTIESVLLREHSGKNIGLLMIQKKSFVAESSWDQYLEKGKYILFRCLDNTFIKTCVSRLYVARDKVLVQSKQTKQVLLGAGVIIGTFILFSVLSSFFNLTSEGLGTEQAKNNLLQAQQFIVTASENMNDADMFTYNIEKAEEIISSLGDMELFLGDIQKLQGDISLLQKKMNGIEVFEVSPDDVLLDLPEANIPVGIVDVAGKKYFIGQQNVVGPISSGEEPETYTFTQLLGDDAFLSATSQDSDIMITTKTGKMVRFSDKNFSYVDVENQEKWSYSEVIENYARNLYLLSDDKNQILMHRKTGNTYESAVSYLTDEDAIATGRILDIAIDGGIYILKLDGSMLKLFRSPSYRLESLSLNNLPKNYNFDSLISGNLPEIQTQANLKYLYMLLGNKILIFQPNTLRFQDVKSLTYVGQIESQNRRIQKFYVENDGELFIADEQGVFKTRFEVLDDRIIIK